MKSDRRTKIELIRDLNVLRKQIKRLEIDFKKKSSSEERVRKALAWQKVLVEGSRDPMVVTDIDSRIITV
jgi:PAS domain-containing protein